jgi:hypothetical protein
MCSATRMDKAATDRNHAEFMRQFQLAKQQAGQGAPLPISTSKHVAADDIVGEFAYMIVEYLPQAIAASPFKVRYIYLPCLKRSCSSLYT